MLYERTVPSFPLFPTMQTFKFKWRRFADMRMNAQTLAMNFPNICGSGFFGGGVGGWKFIKNSNIKVHSLYSINSATLLVPEQFISKLLHMFRYISICNFKRYVTYSGEKKCSAVPDGANPGGRNCTDFQVAHKLANVFWYSIRLCTVWKALSLINEEQEQKNFCWSQT